MLLFVVMIEKGFMKKVGNVLSLERWMGLE